MDENPHKLPAPKDRIERIHDFARDLAYGVAQGMWNTSFYDSPGVDRYWRSRLAAPYVVEQQLSLQKIKWQENPPSPDMLMSFGYVTSLGESVYLITQKAFELLQKPTTTPTVFISYKRGESSHFALLVEARLRHVGIYDLFLDKSISAGTQWHALLEEKIQQCKVFICLIGQEALQSPFVQKEIEMAEKAGCRIISIWDGCTLDSHPHEILGKYQNIQIKGNAAIDYEDAISRLLNDMGYSTY